MLLGLRAARKEEAGVSAAEATYGHSLVLPSQLQPPPRAPQVPPEKVIIPSTVKPAKEAEKVQEVGVQEASHVYVWVGQSAGCHVPRPIPRTDQGKEEAAPGDWCNAAVGLRGPPEAAHGGSDPGGGAAASSLAP